jgi:hypothetical protein
MNDMLKNENVIVKYEGKYIRIGISKATGNTYMQLKKFNSCPHLWYRFEPEYYCDYAEYIKDYCDCLNNDIAYQNFTHHTVLDGETLEHYINIFNATSVYINDECIYNKNADVSYTIEQYKEDMRKMDKLNFYPFIEHIDIDVVDDAHFELRFKTNIKHKGNE